jgi:hypothetical protein
VKKVIEKLAEAKRILRCRGPKLELSDFYDVYNCIADALIELEAPRWYTPERREAETGEAWPEDWGVYVVHQKFETDFYPDWYISDYRSAKYKKDRKEYAIAYIICATEAGPPPDGWRPEEEK